MHSSVSSMKRRGRRASLSDCAEPSAHVSGQCARRKRDIREAGLQEIAGIGPTRKRALLRHFGTLKAIERASVADLRQVDWSRISALVLAPGVPLTHPAPHWTVALARAAAVEVIGGCERAAHGNCVVARASEDLIVAAVDQIPGEVKHCKLLGCDYVGHRRWRRLSGRGLWCTR